MFGWRRRSEGFEWREYVRTTVLVRRADRQRKIDDVRMAALAKVKDTKDKVKDTKDSAVAAGRATAEAASNRIADFVIAVARTIWRATAAFAVTCWTAAIPALFAIFERLPAVRDLTCNIRRPRFMDRARDVGRMMPDVGFRLPFDPRFLVGGAIALALVLIGGPMLSNTNAIAPARVVQASSSNPSDSSLTGRAFAVSGELLRIGGKLVKLTGIEAPEAKHPCLKENGRRWNCSATARSALERIVRGKSVSCLASSQNDDGLTLAACHIEDADVGGELVRGGYVFAADGFFAAYSSAEDEARNSKLGIWQGETVRPKEWREQVWEEAKRAAPDGCPIKGLARASNHVYAMPWSAGYDGAKVRTVKGDRWFCSEEEARAAGFTSSSRS